VVKLTFVLINVGNLFIVEEINSKDEVDLQKPLKGLLNLPGANLRGEV